MSESRYPDIYNDPLEMALRGVSSEAVREVLTNARAQAIQEDMRAQQLKYLSRKDNPYAEKEDALGALTQQAAEQEEDMRVRLKQAVASAYGAQQDPFDTELANLAALHAKKRHDYTGGAHPLANFKAAGEAIGVSTQDAMMLRLAEKFYRMVALRGKEPQCEDLDETDRDIAIIALLRILNRKVGSGYDG